MKTWSLACTACGKCCNSAPQMSIPELFHHQKRFIGCLSLRRMSAAQIATTEQARELASRILHPFGSTEDRLLIATQAYDDGSSGRCPALNADGRCDVNSDRKPVLCSASHSNPCSPTHNKARCSPTARDAAFMGANCIVASRPARSLPLLEDDALSSQARRALEQRRRDLALERRFWGDAVFRTLPPELFTTDRMPARGQLTLSIVPALGVLTMVSERCRHRSAEAMKGL